MLSLQSRWKLDNNKLTYYGLRNKKYMFNNIFKLNKKELDIVKSLPKELNENEKLIIKKLIDNEVVVDSSKVRIIPKSLDEATFCKDCSMNDYIVPGVEFDENGLCPICQTKDIQSKLKGVNPIKNTFPVSKKSRFDVAVFILVERIQHIYYIIYQTY